MSLVRISLRDFVIVHELELELSAGFGVLSGETGAGKSILIDALQLATGARADSTVVREGASRAEVSAEFDSDPGLQMLLAAGDFDADDTVLLRRTVDSQGKSRAWINGGAATLTFSYRAGWNTFGSTATADRSFRVVVQPSGGGAEVLRLLGRHARARPHRRTPRAGRRTPPARSGRRGRRRHLRVRPPCNVEYVAKGSAHRKTGSACAHGLEV